MRPASLDLLDRWESVTRRRLCRQLERVGISHEGGAMYRALCAAAGAAPAMDLFTPLSGGGVDWDDPASVGCIEKLLIEAQRRVVRVEAQLAALGLPPSVRVSWPDWELLKNRGPRFPPADEAEIESTESRLGVRLPPAYRTFLQLTNGWLCGFGRLLGAGEVNWARAVNASWIAEWNLGGMQVPDEVYDVYGPRQQPAWFRAEYLNDLLQITAPIDELNQYAFLCPRKIFENGEWEAWEMSVALAGAARFKSFDEWLAKLEEQERIAPRAP